MFPAYPMVSAVLGAYGTRQDRCGEEVRSLSISDCKTPSTLVASLMTGIFHSADRMRLAMIQGLGEWEVPVDPWTAIQQAKGLITTAHLHGHLQGWNVVVEKLSKGGSAVMGAALPS